MANFPISYLLIITSVLLGIFLPAGNSIVITTNACRASCVQYFYLRFSGDFSVGYKLGASNAADYMFRHLTKSRFLAQEKIDDREIKGLKAAVTLNRWDMDTVKPYKCQR